MLNTGSLAVDHFPAPGSMFKKMDMRLCRRSCGMKGVVGHIRSSSVLNEIGRLKKNRLKLKVSRTLILVAGTTAGHLVSQWWWQSRNGCACFTAGAGLQGGKRKAWAVP